MDNLSVEERKQRIEVTVKVFDDPKAKIEDKVSAIIEVLRIRGMI